MENTAESQSLDGEVVKTKEKTNVPEVFKKVLNKTGETLTNFKREKEEEGRVAVVISVYDTKLLLPETLRETVDQLKQSNLQGEIFVVLNNSGGDTRAFLDPKNDKQINDRIAADLGVNEIIFGVTEVLSTSSEDSRVVPRGVTLEKDISAQTDGIKLVVIDQQPESDNQGKLRGLRDVYALLGKLNQETGYCPRYLLAIDAETRLRPIDNKGVIKTEINSGLSHMIELSVGGEKLVGAKLQFVPFDGNGNPDWKTKTPPMQEAISIMHGMKGYQWLPGGATLGAFPEMVSILTSITQTLPGTRIEDVLTTVTAKTLGIETVIDKQVVHTNNCPYEEEKDKVSEQIQRWLKGAYGLPMVVGSSLS